MTCIFDATMSILWKRKQLHFFYSISLPPISSRSIYNDKYSLEDALCMQIKTKKKLQHSLSGRDDGGIYNLIGWDESPMDEQNDV